jgi:hypothetical protein
MMIVEHRKQNRPQHGGIKKGICLRCAENSANHAVIQHPKNHIRKVRVLGFEGFRVFG